MLGLLATIAWAAEPDPEVAEEVIVYADPLGPWDDTRWWVAAESISATEPLDVTAAKGRIVAPAWQVSAVIHCNVVDYKRRGGIVECQPEDVALRVVTQNQWQREADRLAVNGGLADLVREMESSRIRLRVRDHGDVELLREQAAGDITSRVLERAMDAFHLDLPDGGWSNGDQWVSNEEPLLELAGLDESFGLEQVVHYGNRHRGHLLIQTIAASSKATIAGSMEQQSQTTNSRAAIEQRFQAQWSPLEDGAALPPIELLKRTELELKATAILDDDLGFVTERVWVVEGTGSLPLTRSGRLRLLGADEEVDLGLTGQISPPWIPRPNMPPWLPVDPDLH